MPMKRGEVWFAEFPFEEDEKQTKKRPVVVLDNGTVEAFKVLSIKITSRQVTRDEYDVDLLYWQNARLRFSSIVRTSKYMFLDKSKFLHKIGDLHEDDLALVETKFMEFALNLA